MELDYAVDFDLLAKKEGGSKMSVGRYDHFVNDIDLKELLNSTESKNTRKNTNWSVTTFHDWRSARMLTTGDQIPDILSSSAEELILGCQDLLLKRKAYPPKTLYMLCTGLLRHLRENGLHLKFLDEKNSQFYEFRKSLGARMAELTVQGVGTSTKQAEPISEEAENVLWEKGLLGNSTGESMLNTVFFYNCKLFGLRAVDEHKTLSVDQFELGQDQKGKCINFTGRENKTYKGKMIYKFKHNTNC
ncbi:zinc finger MYM-type protein 2-like [Saccostrea echinata]|uniref:zinc finger MYM-type protein 2-like n=1 Tax=Saccostrea echinata TaxID=191078 RepID=UPI002A80446D|nr:zinc finger MYM-type protein 2-like [Saccostrea echinata]